MTAKKSVSRERNIATLVRFGEDTTLEFKRVIFQGSRIVGPDRRDIADEISAMANTTSGRIVFGVDDKTRTLLPLTIPELDLLETWIGSICADLVDPPLTCLVRKIPVADDHGVIVLDVPRSVFVHKGAHGYFTRIGSAKRELSPDALARLFQQKSQTRIVCFDEQVVADAEVTDLQPVDAGGVNGTDGGIKEPIGGVKVENGGVKEQIGGAKTENGGVKDLADDLLCIIRQNPGLRVPDLVKLTGATRRTVERYLRSRLAKLVEFRGAPKNGGYYFLKHK